MKTLKLKATVKASPLKIYRAWMDAPSHAQIIGADAKIIDEVDTKFSMWGKSISGKNLDLIPGRKIIQAWRADDFPRGSRSSTLSITLKKKEGATEITLEHTGLPEENDIENYIDGWKNYYFKGLKSFFKSKGTK